MSERSELLRQVLDQDPKNTFARYALAQDYTSDNRLEDAVAEFARLMEIDPDYTAAYFHGGKTSSGWAATSRRASGTSGA